MATRMVRALSVVCLLYSGFVSTANAQVPETFGWFGMLSDDVGLVNRSVSITVGLYELPAPGPDETAMWLENHDDVVVVDGQFFITLGSSAGLNPDWFEQSDLYFEFVIDGEPMMPRVALDSVPFALRSATAEEATELTGFDPATVHPRFSADCGSESFVRTIGEDGSATCGVDRVLDETELRATLDAIYQFDVSAECPAGSAIRLINDDGTIECEAEAFVSQADVEGWCYHTESELTTDLDDDYVDYRDEYCGDGSSLRGWEDDGDPICEVDNVLDQTTVEGWCYHTGIELTDALDDIYVDYRDEYCADGSSLRGWEEDGDPICETDDQRDQATVEDWCYNTESELTGALDDNYVPILASYCPAGSALRGFDVDDTPICETDDEPTQTTVEGWCYNTEAELTGALDDTYVPILASYCPAGSALRGFDADDSPICEDDDQLTQATVEGWCYNTEGELTGALDDTYVPILGSYCPAGSALRGFDADDSPICEDDDQLTQATVEGWCYNTEGELTGALDDNYVPILASYCPAGSALRGFDADDSPICETDDQRSQATVEGWCYNTEGELTGLLDDNYVPILGSYCPAGSALRGFDADDSPICETDDQRSQATVQSWCYNTESELTDVLNDNYVNESGDTIDGNLVINGTLTVNGPSTGNYSEDFDDGWAPYFSGTWNWATDSYSSFPYSFKSSSIGDNGSTSLFMTLTLDTAGQVSFYRRTSSEDGYDWLSFYIDDGFQARWSGDTGWGQVGPFEISAGEHTLEWRYTKDGSDLFWIGEDAVWLDNISITNTASVVIAGGLEVSGLKNFVQPHPTDPSLEIVYVSLEGGEAGTYWRGTSELTDGEAIVELPEHFSLVTGSEGMTVQITPLGPTSGLWIEERTPERIVVRSHDPTEHVAFDYLVQGVRLGFEHHQVIREREVARSR